MPEAYHPDDQLLADFIEGRLADSDQTRVESHIRDCSECCKRLGKLTLLNLRAETLDRGFVRQDVLNTERVSRMTRNEGFFRSKRWPNHDKT